MEYYDHITKAKSAILGEIQSVYPKLISSQELNEFAKSKDINNCSYILQALRKDGSIVKFGENRHSLYRLRMTDEEKDIAIIELTQKVDDLTLKLNTIAASFCAISENIKTVFE